MNLTRYSLLFASLGTLAALALIVATVSGSAHLSIADSLAALAGGADATARELVLNLRLPRALTAFGVGGMLAVAGVLMQVLLRNPLAEPYILGSSGGAAVFALLAIMLGFSSFAVDTAAFSGALVATLIVFWVAHGTGSWTPTRLLLTGIVLASGFGAATTLLLALSPDQHLRGMLFWLMGDLSFAYEPLQSLVLLFVIVGISLTFGRHLNVLAHGELQAAVVGLPVRELRYGIFVLASLATAISVTTVGVIGFIGLVVPHLIRLLVGSDHRIVIPTAALGGGTLLVIADTLARTLLAPRQLPVGALTAAIGVPLFLMLMAKTPRYR